MQEAFLHYVWKFQKLETTRLKTTKGVSVTVLKTGNHNTNSGPDFFNAQIMLDDQKWVGNVEIHLTSSDWYTHNHEIDPAYNNVILHVVWEYNVEVFRADNTLLDTLELKQVVNPATYQAYQKLFFKKKTWIYCESDFKSISKLTMHHWLERLFFERLERKSHDIQKLLKASSNNWEAVLFKLLTKSFGLTINKEAFLSLSNSFDFNILIKQQYSLESLEALFFGQTGLLNDNSEELYEQQLLKEYRFLKNKYRLDNTSVLPCYFFRLRPSNFPTIRLSQLANLYHRHINLFSKIIDAKSKNEIYKLFDVKASEYWDTHYTFSKISKRSFKNLSRSFIELLIINVIIPIKFSFAQNQGQPIIEELIDLISQIPPEKNAIVSKFDDLKKTATSALQSQALVQLKTEYCEKHRCLQCRIGNALMS